MPPVELQLSCNLSPGEIFRMTGRSFEGLILVLPKPCCQGCLIQNKSKCMTRTPWDFQVASYLKPN